MFLVRVTGWFFSVEDPDVRGPRLSKMVRFHGQHLSQLAFLVPGTNCECISMLRRIDRVRSISSDRSRHPSLMNSRPATCCPKLRHVGPLSFSPFPRFLHVTPPLCHHPQTLPKPGAIPGPLSPRHGGASPPNGRQDTTTSSQRRPWWRWLATRSAASLPPGHGHAANPPAGFGRRGGRRGFGSRRCSSPGDAMAPRHGADERLIDPWVS